MIDDLIIGRNLATLWLIVNAGSIAGLLANKGWKSRMKCGMLFLCKSHVQGQTTCISSYFQSSTLNWLWPSLKNAALSWFRRSLYKNLDPGSEPDFPKLAQSVFMCEEPPALHMFELCCPEVLCNQFLCMAKYPPCNSHTDSGLLSFKRAGHAYMHWWRNNTAQSFEYSFPLGYTAALARHYTVGAVCSDQLQNSWAWSNFTPLSLFYFPPARHWAGILESEAFMAMAALIPTDGGMQKRKLLGENPY